LGSAFDRCNDQPVSAARHWVHAEHHSAGHGLYDGLYQYCDGSRFLALRLRTSRKHDLDYGATECSPTADSNY
jgi:hypothetical protein